MLDQENFERWLHDELTKAYRENVDQEIERWLGVTTGSHLTGILNLTDVKPGRPPLASTAGTWTCRRGEWRRRL